MQLDVSSCFFKWDQGTQNHLTQSAGRPLWSDIAGEKFPTPESIKSMSTKRQDQRGGGGATSSSVHRSPFTAPARTPGSHDLRSAISPPTSQHPVRTMKQNKKPLPPKKGPGLSTFTRLTTRASSAHFPQNPSHETPVVPFVRSPLLAVRTLVRHSATRGGTPTVPSCGRRAGRAAVQRCGRGLPSLGSGTEAQVRHDWTRLAPT